MNDQFLHLVCTALVFSPMPFQMKNISAIFSKLITMKQKIPKPCMGLIAFQIGLFASWSPHSLISVKIKMKSNSISRIRVPIICVRSQVLVVE